MKNGFCPCANRQASTASLRCAVLREGGAKWDFCVHQRFCRVSGKYELDSNAAKCRLRKDGGENLKGR